MEWLIAEVEAVAVGTSDRDVLFEVHYWYDDFGRGLGHPPDFVEHHLVVGVPDGVPEYEEHPETLGWLRNVSGGESIQNWHEDAETGEWRRGPDPALVGLLRVKRTPEQDQLRWLSELLDSHAKEVMERRPMGIDRFDPDAPLDQGGRPPRVTRAKAVGNAPHLRALRGQTKRLSR